MPILRKCAALAALMAAANALAQAPDCTVIARTDQSGPHASPVVFAPGRAVTLEAHCNYGPSDPSPSFQWSVGGTSFDKAVNAPSQAGATATYTVNVTQFGTTRAFSVTIAAAAAGTPTCTVRRDPATVPVPAFTPVTLTADCTGATTYQWTSGAQGVDLRDATSQVATAFHVQNPQANVGAEVDLIASNASGVGALVESGLTFAPAAPSCRIASSPAGTVAPGQSVTLTAECDGAPTGYTWSTGQSSSSVTVSPAATTEYTLFASSANGASATVRTAVPVAATAPGLRNFTAHWWGGVAENGWGVAINQHGEALFAVIYYYDPAGHPTWAVLPAGTWDATHTSFTGNLYVPFGAPYTNYDPAQFTANAAMGSATLTFTDSATLYLAANMGYAGGDSYGEHTTYLQKKLTPLISNTGANPSGANYAEMWWGGQSQNGWGISMNQAGSTLFAAWFTYGADHRPTWFIFQGNTWSGSTLSGIVYRAHGTPMLGVAYDPASFVVSTAGTGTMSFAAPDAATFAYTIDGVAGSKAITKEPF